MEISANDLTTMVARLTYIMEYEQDEEIKDSAKEVYKELKEKAGRYISIVSDSHIFTIGDVGAVETIRISIEDSGSSDFFCNSLDCADSYADARDILHSFIDEVVEDIKFEEWYLDEIRYHSYEIEDETWLELLK